MNDFKTEERMGENEQMMAGQGGETYQLPIKYEKQNQSLSKKYQAMV